MHFFGTMVPIKKGVCIIPQFGITYISTWANLYDTEIYYNGDACYKFYNRAQTIVEICIVILTIFLDLAAIIKFRKHFRIQHSWSNEESTKNRQERIMLMMVRLN